MKPDGYATKVSGQLLHVDASTSLQVIYHYANCRPRFSNAMTVSFFLLRQYQQFVYGAERDGPLQIGRFQDEQQQQYVKQNAGQSLFTFQRRGVYMGDEKGHPHIPVRSHRLDFHALNRYGLYAGWNGRRIRRTAS